MTRCTKCLKERQDKDFSPDKRKSNGLQSWCRFCLILYKRKRYRENSEKLAAKSLEYYRKNPKTQEQKTAKAVYDREYRKRRKGHLDKIKEDWREKNVEKVRAIKKSYKFRRRANESGGISTADLQAWAESQDKICHWCGVDCGESYHIDHYIPLSRGGKHEEENLVMSCPPCNTRKNNKMPEEFVKQEGLPLDVLRNAG